MTLNFRTVGVSDPDFAQCMTIRRVVFIGEQNVPEEEEIDDLDAGALHFLAEQDGVALGTARVLFKGAAAKITRVAVLREARGLGVGAALMTYIERAVPGRDFVLDAQMHALAFYERLGYVAEGDVFMDAGIPHRHMRKRLA
jgi:ElaA protein